MSTIRHSPDIDTHTADLLDGQDVHDVALRALARYGAEDCADALGLTPPATTPRTDTKRAIVRKWVR